MNVSMHVAYVLVMHPAGLHDVSRKASVAVFRSCCSAPGTMYVADELDETACIYVACYLWENISNRDVTHASTTIVAGCRGDDTLTRATCYRAGRSSTV